MNAIAFERKLKSVDRLVSAADPWKVVRCLYQCSLIAGSPDFKNAFEAVVEATPATTLCEIARGYVNKASFKEADWKAFCVDAIARETRPRVHRQVLQEARQGSLHDETQGKRQRVLRALH